MTILGFSANCFLQSSFIWLCSPKFSTCQATSLCASMLTVFPQRWSIIVHFTWIMDCTKSGKFSLEMLHTKTGRIESNTLAETFWRNSYDWFSRKSTLPKALILADFIRPKLDCETVNMLSFFAWVLSLSTCVAGRVII